jgi:hypothetical protein
MMPEEADSNRKERYSLYSDFAIPDYRRDFPETHGPQNALEDEVSLSIIKQRQTEKYTRRNLYNVLREESDAINAFCAGVEEYLKDLQ